MMEYIFALLSMFMFSLAHASSFTINSNTFMNGKIPPTYTCDDANISPKLTWTNAPANTQSFALIMSDPDAPNGTFYHWIIYNIPGNVSELAEGLNHPPEGVAFGKNSWNNAQYGGPCPPQGSTHRYIFDLYALDTTLNFYAQPDASAVLNAIKDHVIDKANFQAMYGR